MGASRIQGILNGDLTVLKQLYSTVGKTIIGHVIKNNGTKNDGDDIFRLALITVREKIKSNTYNDQGKLEQFILGIARNFWLEELRRRRKRKTKETSLTEKEFWIADKSRSIEQKIIEEEEISFLHRSIQMLDKPCRELFQQHYFEELSLVEIAAAENSKAATVRKRHFDCKKKLKELFLTGKRF